MSGQIMLIGGVGSGKTTLKQALSGETPHYLKTQAISYGPAFIDIPGEYLEIPKFYHIIISSSAQAKEIWAIQDAGSVRSLFAPNFFAIFRQPVRGIITKCDLATARKAKAREYLRLAGVKEPYIEVAALTGQGLHELVRILKK